MHGIVQALANGAEIGGGSGFVLVGIASRVFAHAARHPCGRVSRTLRVVLSPVSPRLRQINRRDRTHDQLRRQAQWN